MYAIKIIYSFFHFLLILRFASHFIAKKKNSLYEYIHLNWCVFVCGGPCFVCPSEFDNHAPRDDDSQGDEHAAGAATTIPGGRRRVGIVRVGGPRGSRPSRRVAGPGSSAADPLTTPSAAASPGSVPARRVRLCRRVHRATRAATTPIEGPAVSHPRGYTPHGKDNPHSLAHSLTRSCVRSRFKMRRLR